MRDKDQRRARFPIELEQQIDHVRPGNPVPIKTAMELAGHCSADLRLPMVPMSPEKRASLEATLKDLGIIS